MEEFRPAETEVDETVLRKRTRRSFMVGGALAALALGLWRWILSRGPVDEIAGPFRKMLEVNEALWRKRFSRTRVASSPSVPANGTPFRTNGDVGLDDPSLPAAWRLEVEAGKKTFSLRLDELSKLPWTTTAAEFRCIEGWSEPLAYAGIRFSDFMSAYGIADEFPYVGLETPDGEYYVSIDADSMQHVQTLLALEMNGVPLTEAHGAPLRLIIPVKYGVKNLKRIGKITFATEKPPDYWEERGYDWYAGL